MIGWLQWLVGGLGWWVSCLPSSLVDACLFAEFACLVLQFLQLVTVIGCSLQSCLLDGGVEPSVITASLQKRRAVLWRGDSRNLFIDNGWLVDKIQ